MDDKSGQLGAVTLNVFVESLMNRNRGEGFLRGILAVFCFGLIPYILSVTWQGGNIFIPDTSILCGYV